MTEGLTKLFSKTTLLACLVGICVSLWMGIAVADCGADFNQFFAAAQLAGSGHVYDSERIQALERLHGTTTLHFGRLPFYAFVIKPLTLLPYWLARLIWFLAGLSALLFFALRWPVERRGDLVAMLCWSCPAAFLLATGQDSALFLCFWTTGLLLLQSDQDFAAGLILSLCAGKFHLALGIPVFLIARRKWTTLAAGLAGGVIQLAVSFAVEGPQWPANLLRLASLSDFSPAPAKMPNLLGLTHLLPYGTAIEAAMAALVLAGVWVTCRRSSLAIGATAAIIGGVLVGRHAYVYDCILLLPALALARESHLPAFIRNWALVVCAPIPYLLLIQDRTADMVQPVITGFCLVLLAYLVARSLGLGIVDGSSFQAIHPEEACAGTSASA